MMQNHNQNHRIKTRRSNIQDPGGEERKRRKRGEVVINKMMAIVEMMTIIGTTVEATGMKDMPGIAMEEMAMAKMTTMMTTTGMKKEKKKRICIRKEKRRKKKVKTNEVKQTEATHHQGERGRKDKCPR